MRKINLKNGIKQIFDTIKATIKQNKRLLFIGLIFLGLGLLFSLFGIGAHSENHPCDDIFSLIKNGEFSIPKFELLLICFCFIPIAVCFFLSLNYFLFLGSFIVICVTSFLFWRYLITCFICGFFSALLTFIIILLPIACIWFIGTVIFIAKLCALIKYPPCKKFLSITPYGVYFQTTKKYLLNYAACVIAPIFVYTNFVIIIAFLICGA